MLSVLLEPNAQVARKEAGEMAGPRPWELGRNFAIYPSDGRTLKD